MKSEEELQPIPGPLDWANAKISGQAKAEQLSHVLLNDGHWYEVKPGTFHLYKTYKNEVDKTKEGIPFVRFSGRLIGLPVSGIQPFMVIEVFPATVAGWAYKEDES